MAQPMIAIPRPSLALNAVDAPGARYRMSVTKPPINKKQTASSLIEMVVKEAKSQKQGWLESLVINCHGGPAEMDIGSGFARSNAHLFRKLCLKKKGKPFPLVTTIYLVVCWVAKIGEAGGTTDGNLFCCSIAKNAHAFVVAPREMQEASGSVPPPGSVDRFEGDVYLYHPDGSNRLWDKKPRALLRKSLT